MTGPDDTTPPSAADDTWPPLEMPPYPVPLAIDDCLDDDEPERTWPIIGSAT